MNARTAPPEGWVTVADAAAVLTREGDTIDPSNVSRYLARWPDVPSEKLGKYRFVDLVALRRHRLGNVLSTEKRDARGDAPPPRPAPPVDLQTDDEDDDVQGAAPSSEIQTVNLQLKRLALREKERADALAEGDLVPLMDVVAITTAAMATFVTELERAEQSVAGLHGREVAATFRKMRKEAQAKAAGELLKQARAVTHPKVAATLAGDQGEQASAA